MIPGEPDADVPDGERYVFGRLRRQLPESFSVLHGRRFGLPDGESGEVGFLVIDPARGMLALEVAARPDATVRVSVQRMRASVAALARYLAGEGDFPPGERRLSFGGAVVLPDATAPDPLHCDAFVIGREDLDQLGAAIDRAFEASVPAGPAPTAAAVAATIRALAPALRLVRPLWARIREEGEMLVRLTGEQARILDVLAETPRVAIEGAAGTGKTLLAVEWARRLSAKGERALLLCFNRALADFLARDRAAYAVSHFHRLSLELCRAAGLVFEVPEQGPKQRAFWDTEAPHLLLRALDSRPEALFDAVVVDEAQDFRPDWWPAVEALLRSPGQGQLVAFFDPLQNLFGGGLPERLAVAPTRLTFNCRNTAQIARFAHAVIGSEAGIRPGAPSGAAVELVHVRSDEETIAEVERLLERLIREEGLPADQIVVLSTRRHERSSLAGMSRLGPARLVPLTRRARAGRDAVQTGSVHQFKGLESDVILLVDVHAADPGSTPRHVYVGASRARHLLVVIELRRP